MRRRNALFPIGGMRKADVRTAAHDLDLPNRARKDSQGICFLGQLNYDDFLREHLGERPGEVVEHETVRSGFRTRPAILLTPRHVC